MIAPPQTEPGYRNNGVPKPGADDVYVFPATVRQQGFWYLDQLQPGNSAYNIAVRFRLQGPLRIEALERALGESVRRHESLRTVFAARDGVPMQVVMPRLTIRLERDDLRGGSDKSRHQRAEAITAEEGRLPFDLATGPLFRARLLCLADEEHVLLITVHHIVSDGWSIGILTRELGTLYDAYCQGRASPLSELPLQYPDFAVWQKEWLNTTGLTKQLSYWTRQLSNLPALEIPTDRRRPATQTFGGAIESVLLPKDLTDHLASLGHRENATLFMLLLAAFQLLLHRLTGQNDIFIGSVVAGRSRVELEPLVGLFINPLVFRTNLSGDPPFLQLLARVRETVEQAFASQDVPFERVVDAVQPKRDPSRHPLFQINFLYQRDFVQPFHASGLTLTAIPSLSPGALYDLNFFLVERAEGWRASCEYNPDLYEGTTVRRLLSRFQALLEGIEANPVRRISEFSLQEVASEGREPPDAAIHQVSSSSEELTPESYQPPRDAMESQLVELWERLLKVRRISITADFFDLGGHSLLAAQLLAQVGKAFGTKVPLAAFLHSPTIAYLAARLQTEKASAVSGPAQEPGTLFGRLVEEKWTHPDKQVFPMRLEGRHLPLILVDAGPFHRPLVRSLGSDQPVLGVALPELSLLPKKFTVKDIAANLVQALQESKVPGPYCLAGWSQAGVIAYEMAQQLRSRGQDIATLILLDTNSPEYLRSFGGWKYLPIRLGIWFEKVLYHLWKLRGMPFPEACRYFRERMHRFQPERITRQQGPQAEDDGGMIESWKMQYLVASAYRPEPCDWPLVLVRSRVLQTGWFRDPLLGWGEVAQGGLQLFEMPGEHDAMFLEPDVKRLGSILQQCLRRATTANSQA
jgi:thioesterase domain-containing protein